MARTVTVDLGQFTAPFDAWCTRHRLSRSAALRQLVASIVGDARQQSWLDDERSNSNGVQPQLTSSEREEATLRFTLRLTPVDRRRLREAASRTGLSCAGFLVSAITAAASDSSCIAGKDAVLALRHSNELLARALVALTARRRQFGDDAESPEDSAAGDPGVQTLEAVRQHLTHCASVLRQVEVTRAGARSSKESGLRRHRGNGRRNRKNPAALG
jgi:uncharacterized protein (DUF1778 family)